MEATRNTSRTGGVGNLVSGWIFRFDTDQVTGVAVSSSPPISLLPDSGKWNYLVLWLPTTSPALYKMDNSLNRF